MQPIEVKDLSKYIFNVLKRDAILSNVYVTGEVSNFKRSGGHIYFSLKDEDAMIRCVVFKSMHLAKKLILEDGQKINCRGKITTFDRASMYQILVTEVEDAGLGEIYRKFLLLKEELEKEGLFDIRWKKEIPRYPEKIGVVTADTGAAKHDIVDTIRRRYPICDIYFCPSKVQGYGAALEIADGLRRLDQLDLDTIIFGRGGGSFEDLNAFNDEELLRTVFALKTPTISAVGHETDTMLTDYVADLRAATPTAAAELATPNMEEMLENLVKIERDLEHRVNSRLRNDEWELEQLKKRLEYYRPEERLNEMRKALKDLKVSFDKYYERNLINKINERARLSLRLHRASPLLALEREEARLDGYFQKLHNTWKQFLQKEQSKVNLLKNSLDLLNPRLLQDKGYTKIYKGNQLIRKIDELTLGDELCFVLKDGKVHSEVTGKEDLNGEY